MAKITPLAAAAAQLGVIVPGRTLNLTQHASTPDQVEAGVYSLAVVATAASELLTFQCPPTEGVIRQRAAGLAELAARHQTVGGAVLIGGAPYLMAALEAALYWNGLRAVYSFSQRESVEVVRDGGTVKTTVFKHRGFIPAVERDNWV